MNREILFRAKPTKKDNPNHSFNDTWVEGDLITSRGKCYIHPKSNEVNINGDGWHYEVIPTDALSKCEPFCLPMPLTNYYINRCEFEVVGNIFDNQELLDLS